MPSDDRKGDPSQTLNELFDAVGRLDDAAQARVIDGLGQLIEEAGRTPWGQLLKRIRLRWLEQAERIVQALAPVVRLQLERSGVLPARGDSKVGGMPDLPAGWRWPQGAGGAPLAFVAQLDLSEISGLDSPARLPSAGRLSLFCDHSPAALASRRLEHRLLYTDGACEALAPLDWPDALDDADGVFVEAGLVVDRTWALTPGALPASLATEVERILPRGIGQLGSPPEPSQSPDGERVLLSLQAFDVLRVAGSSESGFGQGSLTLRLSDSALAERAFERSWLLYDPGK